MNIRDWVMFAWRHAAQVVIGAVAAWLVAHNVIGLDETTQGALEAAAFGVGMWAYGIVVHWLETRTGGSLLAKVARGLAKVLMLGSDRQTPVYAPKDAAVQVNGVTKR